MHYKRIAPIMNAYSLLGHTRHLPWYRRYEFLMGSFLFLIIFVIFLLPERGKLNFNGLLILCIFCRILLFSWVGNILGDREKPRWVKYLRQD